MYNTTDVSLNGLAGMDREACFDRCASLARNYSTLYPDSPFPQDWYNKCRAECSQLSGGTVGPSLVDSRNNATTSGAQNFINNRALTVSAPKPLVSPARVNPTFSQVPVYSTPAVPYTAYGANSTYGTTNNPIRLGNTEPAVDNTPDIFKKENLTKTIGITAGILVVGYFAYKEFGGKKSTRRRR